MKIPLSNLKRSIFHLLLLGIAWQSAAQSLNTVIGVTQFGSRRDTAKIDQVIAVKMQTSDSLDSYKVLIINGMSVPGIAAMKVNNTENTIYFKLDENIRTMLTAFIGEVSLNNIVVPVTISVSKTLPFAKAIGDIPFSISLHPKVSKYWIFAVGIPALLLIGLALFNNLLKEDKNIYYSLGRTQLFFWTIIFLVSYLYIWGVTESLPDITGTILVILGISVTTTAAGKVIENEHKKTEEELISLPSQLSDIEEKSEGFLKDILSDNSSINIHRFQNVLFNLTFGIIFIQKAFSSHLLPEFDNNALLLMGISSGTYAGLKITEYKGKKNDSGPENTTIPTSIDAVG